jgi:hypothetical protein
LLRRRLWRRRWRRRCCFSGCWRRRFSDRRRRRDHDRGRSCGLLSRRWRRRGRNYYRLGCRRRHHNSPFRRGRLGCDHSGFLRGGSSYRLLHGRWRSRRCRRRGFHRGRRVLLLLLSFFQQLQNVARFGDFGEVNLGLNLGRGRLFLSGRGRLGGKVLPDSFRFIGFDGA